MFDRVLCVVLYVVYSVLYCIEPCGLVWCVYAVSCGVFMRCCVVLYNSSSTSVRAPCYSG